MYGPFPSFSYFPTLVLCLKWQYIVISYWFWIWVLGKPFIHQWCGMSVHIINARVVHSMMAVFELPCHFTSHITSSIHYTLESVVPWQELFCQTYPVVSELYIVDSISGTFIYVPSGSAFIKRDQLDPWIKDQLRNALLSTILSLQLPNFVSCGRACPSHLTQNLVTVGVKLLIGEWFLFDPWSMDQADLVW